MSEGPQYIPQPSFYVSQQQAPQNTINVRISRGSLKKILVGAFIFVSAALIVIMLCLVGSADSGGGVSFGALFELIAWAVLSLAAAVGVQAWMPDGRKDQKGS